jgi:hypothetical protein
VKIRRLFVMMFSVGAMVFSVATLVPQSAEANEGVCCSAGSECDGQDLCCPSEKLGAYPCSSGADGYCRQSC